MNNLPELNEKQLNFIKEFFRNGGNATEAYRHAFNTTMNTAYCSTQASKLLKNSLIIPWLNYYKELLQNHIEQEIKYTVDDAFKECDELKIIALESRDKDGRPNVTAANKAVEMKIKLKGLIKEDKTSLQNNIVVEMDNIEIDGKTFEFNIGEDVNESVED